MTWAKLDDRFHSHPKIERAQLGAVGLYCKALSYAACHETDGEVPAAWVRRQGGGRYVPQLLDLDLWEQLDGGYLINDFLRFNPSRKDLEAMRERDRRRKIVQKESGGNP